MPVVRSSIPKHRLATQWWPWRTIALLFSWSLQGCIQPQVLQPYSTFDRAATEQALRPGNATIVGQAFKKTVGGDVKYGAGNSIDLYPATPYFMEVLNLLSRRNAFTQVRFDPAVLNYKRTAVADGEGRFKFPGLSAGRYYLETTITWGIPTRYGIETTGGPAASVITVDEGHTAEAILQ